MSVSDGAFLLVIGVLSFALGYVLGVVRVSRYVNKRLTEIMAGMDQIQKHSREIRQIYAKLNNGGDEPKQ